MGWGHTTRMTRLQHVQRASHIALAQLHQTIYRSRQYLDILLLNHQVDQHPDIRLLERTEPEPRAARQQRGRQLVRVVCDDAEARVGRVLFHDAAERHLRGRRHGVGFVEDDQLEGA